MNLIYLFVGIGIGAVMAWLILKNRRPLQDGAIPEFQKQIAVSAERIQSLERTKIELMTERESARSQAQMFARDLARAQTLLGSEEERAEKMRLEFENLAHSILDDKSKKFTELNQTNLDSILKPLQEKIKDFHEKVENVYNNEARERSTLKGEIMTLVELNKQIGKDADNLARALKGDAKQQGNWGELILEKVLEFSGLRKHLFTEEGKLRSFVNVYLNDEDIRYLAKENTATKDGDVVSIVPSIAGGCCC